jgi:hypothetical protein
MRPPPAILLVSCLLAMAAHAQGFKFPTPGAEAEAAAREQAQRQAAVNQMLATPCRDQIRNRKIMVLIAEERNGMVMATQDNYSRHIDVVNSRLQAVGLKTYTPEQIRKQVAQEEINAYFKGDPDRALSASRRLAAQYVLRGVIASTAVPNAVIAVNQVTVNLDFTLADAATGRPLSFASASNASYAGNDVSAMALTLIGERADEVVARLYSDYCRNAGPR